MQTIDYPYFVAPYIEALEHTDDPARQLRLRRLIAVNIGDESTLRDIFHLDSETLADFYPDMQTPSPSTDDTIESFLSKYGGPQQSPATSIPVAPPSDYTAMLEESQQTMPPAQSEEAPAGTDTDLAMIDAFLSANPAPRPRAPRPRRPAQKETENPALTESFARIMIKNGNYSKALEIITELNLKNPEKSIYFADQIRFLRKLIINEQKTKR